MHKDDNNVYPRPHVYIHIGLHKTGTTSIQEFLMDHQKSLEKQGFSFFKPAYNRHSAIELRAMLIEDPQNPLLDSWLKQYGLRFGKTFFNTTIQRIHKALKKEVKGVIFSGEDLWCITPQEAKKLGEIFQGYPVTIIIYLRDLLSWTASVVDQQMKTGIFVLPKTYQENSWIGGGLSMFEDFLKNYRKVFGPENIKVMDWNHEVTTQGSVIPSFLNLIGADNFEKSDFDKYWKNQSINRLTSSYSLLAEQNKKSPEEKNDLPSKESFSYAVLLKQRNMALENLRALEQSPWWRLTYPLRIIHRFLRGELGTFGHCMGYVKGRVLSRGKTYKKNIASFYQRYFCLQKNSGNALNTNKEIEKILDTSKKSNFLSSWIRTTINWIESKEIYPRYSRTDSQKKDWRTFRRSWRRRITFAMPSFLFHWIYIKRIQAMRLMKRLKKHSMYFPAGIGFSDATMNQIVLERCEKTSKNISFDPLSPVHIPVNDLPTVDICIVTHNNFQWIDTFIQSLLGLDYPFKLLTLYISDNMSQEESKNKLFSVQETLSQKGIRCELLFNNDNKGFGAGNNRIIFKSNGSFCLISNIDLTFDPQALRRIVEMALTDSKNAVAWELRQQPFEHPKFYDPITGTTPWNSHACVLFRAEALKSVGGYDETIFMYGEDVELSYRLRNQGFILRYCPHAVVFHNNECNADVGSAAEGNRKQLLRQEGSVFSSIYLRLKYGSFKEILLVPFLGSWVVFSQGILSFLHKNQKEKNTVISLKYALKISRSLGTQFFKAFFHGLGFLRKRMFYFQKKPSNCPAKTHIIPLWGGNKGSFSFYGMNYALMRSGRYKETLWSEKSIQSQLCSYNHKKIHTIKKEPLYPLVTVITRTYKGRQLYLKQALLSVAHQTYPHIEHIIVEDGGNTMEKSLQAMMQITNKPLKFFGCKKVGRSAAGNIGLENARGKWCLFLDDDDFLFCDHIELLVKALLSSPNSLGAYSLAWEVLTDTNKSKEIPYKERFFGITCSFNLEKIKETNIAPIQSFLFDRQLFLDRGGFDITLDACEDWMLWRKFMDDSFISSKKSHVYRSQNTDTKNLWIFVKKITSVYRSPLNPEICFDRLRALENAYQEIVSRNLIDSPKQKQS
jgi:GT2 family glycosyltransferase